MEIDLGKMYFKMSFRFDKSSPEDFALIKSHQTDNYYVDVGDNSLWQKKDLYDFGWGNENGFMRFPKLTFDELWYLITNSTIQENKYGGAYIIEENFPDELLKHLLNIFGQQNKCISEGEKEAFKILKLYEPKNRSNIIGKSFSQIDEDFKNWKNVSERVKKIMAKS